MDEGVCGGKCENVAYNIIEILLYVTLCWNKQVSSLKVSVPLAHNSLVPPSNSTVQNRAPQCTAIATAFGVTDIHTLQVCSTLNCH